MNDAKRKKLGVLLLVAGSVALLGVVALTSSSDTGPGPGPAQGQTANAEPAPAPPSAGATGDATDADSHDSAPPLATSESPDPKPAVPPATNPPPPTGGTQTAQAPGTPPTTRLSLDDATEWEDLRGFRDLAGDPRCRTSPSLARVAQDLGFEAFRRSRSGHQRANWERERRFGAQLHRALSESPRSEFYGRIDRDPQQVAYVQQLVDSLLGDMESPGVTFSVHVLDSTDKQAFAMVGGHLYFSSALLTPRPRVVENEAQLFAIAAHEVAHIDRMHTSLVFDYINSMFQLPENAETDLLLVVAQRVITLPYSSELEDEADRYAYERMTAMGYSPMQFETLWWNWEEPAQARPQRPATLEGMLEGELDTLLQSHSAPAERACAINRLIAQDRAQHAGRRFYVGASNLRNLTPATVRRY